VADMVGHAIPTTFVGHFWLKILLFIFKGCRSLLMVKGSLPLPPNFFWVGSIDVVLAS